MNESFFWVLIFLIGLFEKVFLNFPWLGREERRGELSLPSRGVRGLLFLSSEAVFV